MSSARPGLRSADHAGVFSGIKRREAMFKLAAIIILVIWMLYSGWWMQQVANVLTKHNLW